MKTLVEVLACGVFVALVSYVAGDLRGFGHGYKAGRQDARALYEPRINLIYELVMKLEPKPKTLAVCGDPHAYMCSDDIRPGVESTLQECRARCGRRGGLFDQNRCANDFDRWGFHEHGRSVNFGEVDTPYVSWCTCADEADVDALRARFRKECFEDGWFRKAYAPSWCACSELATP